MLLKYVHWFFVCDPKHPIRFDSTQLTPRYSTHGTWAPLVESYSQYRFVNGSMKGTYGYGRLLRLELT